MFHLSSKKLYFFAVSGLVIIPGLLSLLFWHLNLGIDFTGGTIVDLHFQHPISASEGSKIVSVFEQQTNSKEVRLFFSHEPLSGGAEIFWVKLNTGVDDNVQKEILNRFNSQPNTFGTAKALPPLNGISTDNGKTTFTLLPFLFTPIPSTNGGPAFTITSTEIKTALTQKPLPNTTLPAPASSAATATPAANATATVAATPTVAATATATSSSSATTTSAATVPVSFVDVYQGTTDQIVTLQVSNKQIKPDQLQSIETMLLQSYGVLYQSQVQTVSASIASSTTLAAIFAIFIAAIAILAYIAFAFRDVRGNSFRYGVAAIAALLHDVLVVVGIWSILGHFFPKDFAVDTLFVTAVLTVIGFSVHDTIVVFDRIRENKKRSTVETFTEIVDASLLQTMARSVNTSLTVLITLSALALFGGGSIRSFTLALLIGIFSGTYSSIFNASMILVVWETGEWRTWFGMKQTAVARTSNNKVRVSPVQ